MSAKSRTRIRRRRPPAYEFERFSRNVSAAATGEAVSDVSLIAAHPELMPELGDELASCASRHGVRSWICLRRGALRYASGFERKRGTGWCLLTQCN